ncbi:hypothetical protein [Paracidovorax valerianellae]|uniref:hypothetical protein n=1 Tax=Paracidovorax valerianellae TaxID=187868 RepID=UPI0023021971|nr:hypothetical protein [Paracidovorax valerianellae]MDA8444799.1 hypothetical protein [Paracidovorax valerianellae]UYL85454.1 hypothetical protein gp52 [Acidovorax phage Alfacinha3]UYL85555.1 hypothetical protein gp52 [Acidovorax phage Alfacinha1]
MDVSELLELAAHDDGEALRLAVHLKMDITFENGLVNALATHPSSFVNYGASEMPGDDPIAATRRAIVRVASDIQRATTS